LGGLKWRGREGREGERGIRAQLLLWKGRRRVGLNHNVSTNTILGHPEDIFMD